MVLLGGHIVTSKTVIRGLVVLGALLGLGASGGFWAYREVLDAVYQAELSKAKAGSPKAQLTVGFMHLTSTMGKQDIMAAEKWFHLAAQHEIHQAKEALEAIRVTRKVDEFNPNDQYLLGLAAGFGLNGAPDRAAAWKWFLLAAAGGQADARLNVANLPDPPGLFVEQGKQSALSWAAERGLPRPDFDQLLSRSHEDREAQAIFNVGFSHVSIGRPEMPEVRMDSGRSKAVADYIKRAKAGEAEAQMILAKAYDTPDSFVPDSPKEAAKWYLLAANLKNRDQWGYLAVLRRLGALYNEGYGVSQSTPQALAWFWRAADLGDAEAQFRLAKILVNQSLPPRDYPAIATLLGKAAESGHVPATYFYASMLNAGLGVPRNWPRAYYWASMADAEEFSLAADLLARLKDHLTDDQRKSIEAEVERARVTLDAPPEGK